MAFPPRPPVAAAQPTPMGPPSGNSGFNIASLFGGAGAPPGMPPGPPGIPPPAPPMPMMPGEEPAPMGDQAMGGETEDEGQGGMTCCPMPPRYPMPLAVGPETQGAPPDMNALGPALMALKAKLAGGAPAGPPQM